MRKPIISWTIGAVAVAMLGAGLLTAARAVDTSPDPQVVLTNSRHGGTDDGAPSSSSTSTSTSSVPTSVPGSVPSSTVTSIDDHGRNRGPGGGADDDPATHDVGDDHGGTSGGHGADD
jgi:hypothetical protein